MRNFWKFVGGLALVVVGLALLGIFFVSSIIGVIVGVLD